MFLLKKQIVFLIILVSPGLGRQERKLSLCLRSFPQGARRSQWGSQLVPFYSNFRKEAIKMFNYTQIVIIIIENDGIAMIGCSNLKKI